LCSSTAENDIEEYTALIHPVFGGRFAVPMLQIRKSGSNTVKSPDVLWDAYELRNCLHWNQETFCSRVRQCLKIWYLVMQLFINRTTESFNEMLASLVLWRTILRCLCCYPFDIRNYYSSEYSPLVDEYCSVNQWLARFGTSLDAKINVKNTDSELWERALNAIGY
jgi:hypothetical protein